MLLTITTTYQPATDLGYLLHKRPDRVQSFSLSFGKAHVFYPEASTERCTAALLLDIDPVQLVRGKRGQAAIEHYVNDRPYVASSFLCVAISEVFGPHVIRRQSMHMRRSLPGLHREGFQHCFVLSSPEQIETVEIERQPLWTNLKHEHGPFDIIGDVHGCFDELQELLTQLGYEVETQGEGIPHFRVKHPQERK